MLDKIQELAVQLTSYDSRRTHYPFLGELATPLVKLKAVAAKPAAWFFTECQRSEMDALCDDKEDVFDPIIAFMNGSGREILDHARQLLREQQSNLTYIPHDEIQEVDDIVRDPRCFKGNRMPRLKELTEILERRIVETVEREAADAERRIEALKRRFVALPDFMAVPDIEQQRFSSCFDTIRNEFKQQPLIAVIREQAHDFEETTFKRLAEELYTLAHPVKAGDGKDVPRPAAESVALPRVYVSFRKPWLENDDDIDTYISEYKAELVRLEAALREQVKNGKRIKL